MREIALRKTDYLEKFLKTSPVFYAFLRAIECRNVSGVAFAPPILDLGCGDGVFGSNLFEGRQGAIACGIDLSQKDIRQAQKTGVYRLLQVADISHLPLASNSIGTIFSNSVFEHLENIDAALKEATRVLKSGGKLIITSPNDRLVDNFLLARFFRSMGVESVARVAGNLGNRALGNRKCLSAEQWREAAYRAGFSSVKCTDLVPPPVFHISELFMPFGAVSIISKRLTGRLLFVQRRLTLKPLHFFLRKHYRYDGNGRGLAHMIVSVK